MRLYSLIQSGSKWQGFLYKHSLIYRQSSAYTVLSQHGFLNRFILVLSIRWVSIVEFQEWALGIGKVFGQESTVVIWNYQILSLHLVTVCQKMPILDFEKGCSMWKIIRIFLKKFTEEYQFRHTFYVKSIFCWLQFLNHFITKMTPNFWQTITRWRPKIW